MKLQYMCLDSVLDLWPPGHFALVFFASRIGRSEMEYKPSLGYTNRPQFLNCAGVAVICDLGLVLLHNGARFVDNKYDIN